MALGTTNISFNALNQEFERTATQQFSLDDTRLRLMAGGVTTNISFSSLQSKAGSCNLTISSARSTQFNVAAQAASAGYNRTYQKLHVIVNSGITVYGGVDNPSYPAAIMFNGLHMGGANNQPYGIALINNGTIVGQGAGGSQGGSSYSIAGGGDYGYPGGTGCAGIRADACSVSVVNNGSIIGGSGGGASGQGSGDFYTGPWNGGGGGGGGAPHGPGGAGGVVQGYGGSTAGNAGSTATYSTGGAGASSVGGGAGPGYAGGNFGALNGGGIPLATYISNLNAMIRCDGYATGAGSASISNAYNPGAINWIVTGTRTGAIT